jgi:hypothetical protein
VLRYTSIVRWRQAQCSHRAVANRRR